MKQRGFFYGFSIHIFMGYKVEKYRAINTMKGYKEINIYSPPKVIDYESETI
jgi:hypothetical protein